MLRAGRPRVRDAARLPYVPGHIVVKFAEGVSPQAMSTMAADIGGQAVRGVHHADFVYVHIPADADPVAAAAQMSQKPGVVYAEPDGRVFTMFRPNDPLYRYQWNLQKIDMERTWDVNRGAKNAVIVAIIDSGVAFQDKGAFAQAPELKGVPFVSPYDFVWDDTEPFDFDGHGTHIAGTIAQATNNNEGTAGMSFNVSIMPIKAIFTEWDEAFDAPFPYGASTVARAIRYAADNGAKVINLSIGSFFAEHRLTGCDGIRHRQGRLPRDRSRERWRCGQPANLSGGVREGHGRRDGRRRGGFQPGTFVLLERQRLRRDCGPGRRQQRGSEQRRVR